MLIESGHVLVNGYKCKDFSTLIDEHDVVVIDGKQIKSISEKTYVIINKPKLTITSKSDNEGRETVMQWLPEELKHLNPVGRLDYDATGLLLLTDDNELINKLTHPKYHVQKTYAVKSDPPFNNYDIADLMRGVRLEGGVVTEPDDAKVIGDTLILTLHEGHYHHVKRIAESFGKRVVWLKRIGFANLRLGDMMPGEWRHLSKREIAELTGR